jgi:autotransporter adhesin
VNMGQLQNVSNQITNVNNNLTDLDAKAVKYDDISQDKITLNPGNISANGGVTGGTLLTNLQQGAINISSTDATNGAQMQETRDMITNITQGSIRFFQVKSNLGEADASQGTNSIAIGPLSVSSGVASLALGVNSQATADGAVAMGVDSKASGVNAIAIGNGALATGSVAVGAGAQAGNGGAAFGDNAVALVPQQGTAIGNAAVVTANRGVALGAGSTATRAGMNGATERFSNTAVTSTEGAVSVGSAGGERQITNVAGGTADTDAVNVRQLDAAMAQSGLDMSNQINGLRADISTLRDDAYGGIAAAMALASMPQSVIPGKVLIAAGAATYEGQSAMSIGVSNFSENGRWIVNVNGSANTRGKAGAAVGVGFHW